jgi:imidazole glycerol-phosphate synthase subunit HisF
MLQPRIIPCLLLRGHGLVKGVRFSNHRYVGDPINVVQIFNAKEVDEILFLDIAATTEGRTTPPGAIQRIADQCLFPFAVGGGIRTLAQARAILGAGAEKVCLNTAAFETPNLVREIADTFGAQSVIVSIDVRKGPFRREEVYVRCGTRKLPGTAEEAAAKMATLGAGEILLNSIDRDGARQGYDIELLRRVACAVSVPVIAAGGAGTYDHLAEALSAGQADAVAAGSLFVFHGRRQAVLITYPTAQERTEILRRSGRGRDNALSEGRG